MPRAETLPTGPTTPAIVVDNGSGVVKAGLAGEDEPRCLLPTSALGEAQPFTRGIVTDWDAMEACWEHMFTQLRLDTEQCNLLVTSPMYDTKDNKERLLQTLFESFGAPGVWTSAPAVFELYAAGRENGVVLGCGAQATYAVLIHEGLPDPRTHVRSDVAGEALTRHTAQLLQTLSGSPIDAALANRAKEQLALTFPDESGRPSAEAADSTFELPDGKKVAVPAASRAAMTEPLFAPSLVGEHSSGLAQLIADAIRMRDKDGALESTEFGKDGTDNWYSSVVLAGGTTTIPGLPARLTRELARSAPTPCSPVVLAPPERKHAAWLGGSILASLAVAGQMWITKEEYDENGPLIVHRKCF